MQGLLGEYQINLDAKGRLKLPVGYLNQLTPGEDKEFVLNRSFEKCLAFYTLVQWKVVSDQIIANTNEFNTESRTLRRMLLSGATKLSPDSAGRVLLPKGMIEYARMKKEIVYSGQMSKVEIWDAATHKEVNSFTGEDMDALANKVLGNGFTNGLKDGSEI